MKSITLLSGLALGLSLLNAPAYELYYTDGGNIIKRNDRTPRTRASAVGFPSGSSWRSALGDVVSWWNKTPADFAFDLTYDEATVGVHNGQNEIWFSTDDYYLDGAPAVAVSWYTGSNLTESDVLLDANQSYTTSLTPSATTGYGGSPRPVRTAIMHELGHSLGLAHENDTYNMMGDDWNHLHANGTTLYMYPGEDAGNGSVALYGLYTPYFEDVSVTHWKWSGRSGEYSTHTRTVVKNSSGSTLAVHHGTSDDPLYEVTAGQTVQLEYTLENNGAHSQSPLTGFYLSNNSTITTSDTLLDTRTPTIGRNTVFTTTQTLALPSTLTSGQTYYLGVIVDKNDTISEVREDNNATYIGIYVK